MWFHSVGTSCPWISWEVKLCLYENFCSFYFEALGKKCFSFLCLLLLPPLTSSSSYLLSLEIYLLPSHVCVRANAPVGGAVSGVQRTICGSHLFSFINWVPGMKLRSVVLVVGGFTCWDIFLASLFSFEIVFILLFWSSYVKSHMRNLY